MNTRYYAFLAAIAMLLASGVLYHSLASDSEQLDIAAAKVARVPKIVGAWHGQDETTDDRAFAQTGAKGYWTRHYVNQQTKDSVLVILMCGRPGKMAVHTPEVCYSGAGYELQDRSAACAINTNAQFWTAKFTKKTSHLRLYWAWNARGTWEASQGPRWQFRGEPFLYKLYVSRDISEHASVAPEADATAEFLHEFVPALKQTLFGE
jgi:Protein of unknown function (DUF3485)